MRDWKNFSSFHLFFFFLFHYQQNGSFHLLTKRWSTFLFLSFLLNVICSNLDRIKCFIDANRCVNKESGIWIVVIVHVKKKTVVSVVPFIKDSSFFENIRLNSVLTANRNITYNDYKTRILFFFRNQERKKNDYLLAIIQ